MAGLKKSSWLHLLLLVVLLFSEGLAQRRSPSSSRTIRRGSHRTTYRSRQGAGRASTSRTRTQRYGAAGRLRGGGKVFYDFVVYVQYFTRYIGQSERENRNTTFI